MVEKKQTRSRRELIDTGKNKSYVRRNAKGQFDEVSDVGRLLARIDDRAQKQKYLRGRAIAAIRKDRSRQRLTRIGQI